MAVEQRHDRRSLAGKVDQYRRGGAAVIRTVVDAREHDDRGHRREKHRQRQEHRHRRERPDSRQHPDERSKEHPEKAVHEVLQRERHAEAEHQVLEKVSHQSLHQNRRYGISRPYEKIAIAAAVTNTLRSRVSRQRTSLWASAHPITSAMREGAKPAPPSIISAYTTRVVVSTIHGRNAQSLRVRLCAASR